MSHQLYISSQTRPYVRVARNRSSSHKLVLRTTGLERVL